MQNLQKLKSHNNNRASLFIDYVPAELRRGVDWLIVYYVKNPVTKINERKRLRVPKIVSIREREKLAKKMCLELNNRLQKGWSPFLEYKDKFYMNYSEAVKLFLKQTEIEVEKDNKRLDQMENL